MLGNKLAFLSLLWLVVVVVVVVIEARGTITIDDDSGRRSLASCRRQSLAA